MAGKGKRKDPNARQAGENFFAWQSRLARQAQEARDREQPLVTLEAEAHGDYQQDFVTHVETNTKAHTRVNRATDPVTRWKAKNRLTSSQIAGIEHCERLWELASLPQRVTANYGERIYGQSGHSETRNLKEIQARKDLHRIMDYIPGPYFDVFENIVRHAMPVGESAAIAGYTGPGAEIRARTVVCFVADLVAMKERL